MIPSVVVEQIERLLEEGSLSQRKIAQQIGVSRGTVNAIAQGKRVLRKPREAALSEDFFSPDAPIERCPDCGARVRMPCLACRVREERAYCRQSMATPRDLSARTFRMTATGW